MENGPIKLSFEFLESVSPDELWARFFINPAIALMEWYKKFPFPMDIECERIISKHINDNGQLQIELSWRPDTFPHSIRLLKTIQREVVVEYSAVAVAFLLVTVIANCTITEVTLRGEKADYFLNGRELMLEVSGTENSKTAKTRHKEKGVQLQSNPYGKGGYVVVCCFSNRIAHFSFHPPL